MHGKDTSHTGTGRLSEGGILPLVDCAAQLSEKAAFVLFRMLMIEMERRRFRFKTKEVWFSDYPFDVTGYSCAFFMSTKSKVDLSGFQRAGKATLVIDLIQDLDEIWKKMRKTSRHCIKNAQEAGVNVTINQHYSEFQELNSAFRKKKGLPPMSYPLEDWRRYGALFVAEHDGETISGQAYFKDDHVMRWVLAASRRLEVDVATARLIGNASRLLVWEAIKYAKRNGIREFDLGGYYIGDQDSEKMKINTFKRSFRGELVERYYYTKYYSKTLQLYSKTLQSITKLGELLFGLKWSLDSRRGRT